jgi:hypothetical protein
MRSRRSQYATEYLAVVALSTVLLVSVMMILMSNYNHMRYSVSTNQVYSVANNIKENALTIYYLGEGSMTTIYISIPEGIKSSSIDHSEILFNVSAGGGMFTDIFVSSPIKIEGSLPDEPGMYEIKLISRGDRVWIGV